jgi:hypothetical protein
MIASSGSRPPRPAFLGQWRVGIGQCDPPDPVLAERQGEPGELPAKSGVAGGLRNEQRQLMTDRRLDAGELELDPADGGRRRRSFESGEEEPLDRLGFGGRLGEALLDIDLGRGAGAGEGQVEGQPEVRPGRRRSPRLQLVGEGRSESVEDEAERVELLDRRLDRQTEDQAFRGAARAECRDLLASSPGVDPLPFRPEPGDER